MDVDRVYHLRSSSANERISDPPGLTNTTRTNPTAYPAGQKGVRITSAAQCLDSASRHVDVSPKTQR